MGATTTTLSAILQDDYRGPVIEALNTTAFAYTQFKKVNLPWEGKQAVLSVHVSRSTGVDWTSGTLPTAGNQGYKQLTITSKKVYGRFELDGELLAAARKGGKRAFISAMSAEVDGIKENVINAINAATFSGGPWCGFLNEHKVEAGNADWEFSGDISKIVAALAVGVTTVSIYRMDTYAQVGGAITVNSANTATHEINLSALNTSAVADGYGLAVKITAPAAYVSTVNGVGAEMNGIYANLSDPSHYGVDRTTATGDATALQGTIRTAKKTADHARTALTLDIIQDLLDEIEEASDALPTMLVVHFKQRQKYAAILQGQIRATSGDKRGGAPVLNGGFGGLAYGDIPFHTDRHCGKGLILALKLDTWALAELQDLTFADEDGNVLSRVSNSDSFEGYARAYLNLICKRPNANGAVVGLTL